MRSKFIAFLKGYTLPVAIVLGALAYLVYAHVPLFDFSRPYAEKIVGVVQPLLIFSMLFLSFCKIDPKSLRFHKAHLWLLLIQCGSFALFALLLYFFPKMMGRVWIESAMLCMICPTATAASVVTQKLKGDGADITMYTILIGVAVSVVVPLLVPLVNPTEGQSFLRSFLLIISRVFPLLLCPLIAALLVRFLLPGVHRLLLSFHNVAFYLWAVALSLAIAVTVRSLAHTDHSIWEIIGIGVVSLLCCIVQFALGRIIGKHYGRPISTCQSLGQKNTVFAIWMGYTFMNPVTSIAGGLYSIWHNVYNTYQLQKMQKNN